MKYNIRIFHIQKLCMNLISGCTVYIEPVRGFSCCITEDNACIITVMIDPDNLIIKKTRCYNGRFFRSGKENNPVIGNSKGRTVVHKLHIGHNRIQIIITTDVIIGLVFTHLTEIIECNGGFHASAIHKEIGNHHNSAIRTHTY